MPLDIKKYNNEFVILATDALAKLLVGNRTTATACTVQIQQFGTNLLYMPVYLLLADIEQCWKHLYSQHPLSIEYRNFKTDEKACAAVKEQLHPWSQNQETSLAIGLSELSEDSRNEGWSIEFPFIKRLPLWGVALVNNSKINSFKKIRRGRTDVSEASGSEESRAVRREYWKVFGGKLSLLRPTDLVDADLRLGISVYKRGTTAYRLFVTEFLNRLDKPISFTSEVTFENEFDDLFQGIVDVALTVQPWQAVRKAAKLGSELETVYVHQGKPERFSSIYCLEPNGTTDKELLKIVLNTIYLGVQEKIECIYDLKDTQTGSYLSVLQDVEQRANDMAEKFSEPDAKTEIRDFGEDDMNCALHLISDSRIYNYDTVNMSNTDRGNNSESVRQKLLRCADLRSIELAQGDLADPIATITSLVASVPELAQHGDKTLSELAGMNNGYYYAICKIEEIVKTLNIAGFSRSMSGDDFCKNWRYLNLSRFLPKLTSLNPELPAFKRESIWRPNGDDYTFWMDVEILKEAFQPFDQQFTRETNNLSFINAQIGLLHAGEEGISWAWITYSVDHVISAPPDTWHFARHPSAKMLLHGWYVPPDTPVDSLLRPMFDRKHRVSVSRGNKTVSLSYGAEVKELALPVGAHGFLFTFAVTKKKMVLS